MSDKLTAAKDWIYMICTLIQTILALVALFRVNYFWKKKERRETKELLDKEEREKIADLFSQEYNAIELKVEKMKKTISSFQSTPTIVYRHRTVFALDVLRYMYMCQPDHRNNCNNEELKNFCSDMDDIVKLFRNFRIKLPPAADKGKRQCPKNIKEELGPSIIEIGNLIFPFISSTRQKTVTEVLAYFGAEKPSNGTDIGKLREQIPYVNNIRLARDGKIALTDMLRTNSNIKNIELHIEHPIILENGTGIYEKIKLFWTNQHVQGVPSSSILEHIYSLDLTDTNNGNMLHLIRLLIFMVFEHPSLCNDEAYKRLATYLKKLDCSIPIYDATVEANARCLDSLISSMENLERKKSVLIQTETTDVLENWKNQCKAWIRN